MLISKRERFFQAVEEMESLRCPVCSGPLTRAGENLRCPAGHVVNVNRRGFVNLLSRPVAGCYGAELFDARQRVLRSGCYDAVAEAVGASLAPLGEAASLLDAGCGEGFYLGRVLAEHPRWRGAGVDLSRDAILRAADQPVTALWCVADLRRLPFSQGSFDAVLDVLTPAAYAEFRRVLKRQGLLVKVFPGGGYLRELRQACGLPPYEEGEVEAYLREHTRVLRSERVTRTLPVSPALWADFTRMTPLTQDLSEEKKAAVSAAPAGEITIDLHVLTAMPLPE